MENTIIVFYVGETVDHYVGVLSEYPSEEKQKEIAKRLNAVIDGTPEAKAAEEELDSDEVRMVSFRRVTVDSVDLVNIWSTPTF